MRITVAQVDPLVGDVHGNTDRVIRILGETRQKAPDLVVFPELCLVGYPPMDLLERTWFIDRVEEAITRLRRVSREHPETGILFGAPIRTGLRNSAFSSKVASRATPSTMPPSVRYSTFPFARNKTGGL